VTVRLQRVASPFAYTPLSHADVEQSIPERFAQQVCLHGDRLAIQGEDAAPVSFAELNRTTNALARRILARRERRSEPIALLFDHGPDVVAAMLAVLKAGKFYVLLDASSPRERVQFVLSHSQAALIVADQRHLPLAHDLADSGPDVLAFTDPGEPASDADLGIYPSPSDLAAIIYTSGSTGKPKGVMHTHRNILGDMRHVINELGIGPRDRWVWHTSVSFAGSARTVFGALLNGSALYPFDLKKRGFPQLATWLLRHEITVFRSVPTTFRSFMTTLDAELVFPAVRILSMGGEPLFRADVDSFNRHFLPHAVLVHPFGPT
jgi:non-ribosomal peptide synthetase component F